MDGAQLAYIILKLCLGAVLAFFAIMLWSKTREQAWILMVIGAILSYIETVYSILGMFGITEALVLSKGYLPPLGIILSCLPSLFYIAAFAVIIFRKL
ncbi:MAG: hypothetical protein Ta2B_29380 [Termitinemataceae bacterium]|nr:MAG: hypothetical protein Ta2B_29380 [Termitinemataceae bacterium]